MTWKRTIEFPNHPLEPMDVVEILTDSLESNEIEEVAEELLCFIGKRRRIPAYINGIDY
jgi:hypothetical protein